MIRVDFFFEIKLISFQVDGALFLNTFRGHLPPTRIQKKSVKYSVAAAALLFFFSATRFIDQFVEDQYHLCQLEVKS